MTHRSQKIDVHSLRYMSAKLLLTIALIVANLSLEGIPRRGDLNSDGSLQDLRLTMERLRVQLSNQETEIRTFSEKVANQDATLEGLRSQIQESGQANKDRLKSNVSQLEERLGNMETVNKGLIADIKTLKNHSNDLSQVVKEIHQNMAKIEKMLDLQNNNLGHLEGAIKAVMEAIQVKDSLPVAANEGGRPYRVKAGDSLEKIAKDAGCSIQALKTINHLSTDKIVVGQKLVLP